MKSVQDSPRGNIEEYVLNSLVTISYFNLHPIVKKNCTHVEILGPCVPRLQLEQLFLSVRGPHRPLTSGRRAKAGDLVGEGFGNM